MYHVASLDSQSPTGIWTGYLSKASQDELLPSHSASKQGYLFHILLCILNGQLLWNYCNSAKIVNSSTAKHMWSVQVARALYNKIQLRPTRHRGQTDRIIQKYNHTQLL
jgi:hypothetical protein